MLPLFQPLAGLLAAHPLYAIGGVVRAQVLGQPTAGLEADFCTPSLPAAILATSEKLGLPTHTQGLRWGSVQVAGCDVTSFRTEIYSRGSRHPTVAFTANLLADVTRRDFTCNAIYLAPDGKITDPTHGAAHLRAGQVVWLGNPAQKLAEDPLRWWRWLRFCAEVGPASLLAPQWGEAGGTLHPISFKVLAQVAAAGQGSLSANRLAKEQAKFARQPHAQKVRETLASQLANAPELAHILAA